MNHALLTAAAGAALLLAACGQPAADTARSTAQAETPMTETDPMLWAEEVEGEEALAWVRAQNERSLAILEADPRYEGLKADALAIANDAARIPFGSVRNGHVYNFWQDETNVRGLWRRATVASYLTDAPDWEVLLDLDSLSASEGANWVWKGAEFAPGETPRALLNLSDGGKDAVTVREYDYAAKAFVDGGFTLPEAKQSVGWLDDSNFLVTTDWGEGSLTPSGYPYITKIMTREQAAMDAYEVHAAQPEDVGVFQFTLEDADGRRTFLREMDTFFTGKTHHVATDGTTVELPLPPKASPTALHKGQLVATLEQDWTAPDGQAFAQGALIAFPLDAAVAGETPAYSLIFQPSDSQSIEGVGSTAAGLIVAAYDTVKGKALKFAFDGGAWTMSELPVPANGAVDLITADETGDLAMVLYRDFLTPDTLFALDMTAGTATPTKSLPAKFDAEGLMVEQKFATSKDGTRVPYFVIRAEDAPMDGSTPTLLYGYGGFQVSMTPFYSGYSGKMWLERGGAYILANIRGGGEFGPAWHQAGLKQNRQVIYDDFIAVAEDAIASGLTSPRRLGIMGGSNGGLLMGVMLTQRPDLWNAVVIQVPLLDMLRYHLLLAGASWVDEYGSPDVPEERAFLETISPVHNFDPAAAYPKPFFVTSTKDDRVHPGHARKMAKLFEDAGKDFLYYENIDGGHSAAANLQEAARRRALEWTYLSEQLMD